MPFKKTSTSSFEERPEEEKLKSSQEIAIEKAEEIEVKESEKKEISIESQIEKLEDDERKFFEIQKRTQEVISELDVLRYEGKINDQDWRKMAERISFLQQEAVNPLAEKIDREKQENIRELFIKQLDKETQKGISESNDFEELYKTIYRSGGLQSTKDFFTPDKLKSIIDRARKGEIDTNHITRTGGLRERVEDLLKTEKIQEEILKHKISEAKDFYELFQIINKSKGIQGSERFFTPKEIIETMITIKDIHDKTEQISDLAFLTRSAGLRDKVLELLKKDKF